MMMDQRAGTPMFTYWIDLDWDLDWELDLV